MSFRSPLAPMHFSVSGPVACTFHQEIRFLLSRFRWLNMYLFTVLGCYPDGHTHEGRREGELRGAVTLAQAGEGRSRCNSAPMHGLRFHKLILYK